MCVAGGLGVEVSERRMLLVHQERSHAHTGTHAAIRAILMKIPGQSRLLLEYFNNNNVA